MSEKVVTFGEIMMRLSPPGFLRFGQARSFDVIYGGGEANVAASLANYGLPVDFVTRLPDNDLGEACIQFLRQYGIGTAKIVRGGDRLVGTLAPEKGFKLSSENGLAFLREPVNLHHKVCVGASDNNYLRHASNTLSQKSFSNLSLFTPVQTLMRDVL